jgi:hypothetical protein
VAEPMQAKSAGGAGIKVAPGALADLVTGCFGIRGRQPMDGFPRSHSGCMSNTLVVLSVNHAAV